MNLLLPLVRTGHFSGNSAIFKFFLCAFANNSILKVNPFFELIGNSLIVLLENNLNQLVASFVGKVVKFDRVKDTIFTINLFNKGAPS